MGTAPARTAVGTALITLQAGLRDKTTEQPMSRLPGWKDQGYPQRRATTSIGYLLPGRSWRDWLVTPGNTADRAEELASAVHTSAEPYPHALAFDRTGLLATAKFSAGSGQATSPSRVAIMLAPAGRPRPGHRLPRRDNPAGWRHALTQPPMSNGTRTA